MMVCLTSISFDWLLNILIILVVCPFAACPLSFNVGLSGLCLVYAFDVYLVSYSLKAFVQNPIIMDFFSRNSRFLVVIPGFSRFLELKKL